MKRTEAFPDTILHQSFTDLLSCLLSLHWHTIRLFPRRYNFTSATFEKKKAKQYVTPYGMYTYRDVPSEAYPVGIVLHSENGYGFQMASPEKAICDELYTISPLRNRGELERLLFEDLRIDREEFFHLKMADLLEITTRYHTQNHKLLQAYLGRSMEKPC